MKKLFNVLVLTLAVNFLAVAGAVGWLYRGHHLDRERVAAIKEILFPKPVPATQPVEAETKPTTQPIMKLEELLARQAGRSSTEQVEFIQHSFDAQMAQLDRRNRELNALLDQVNQAKAKLSRDREQLAQERAELAGREQLASQLETDKGFQDSLALYNAMPGKQVKTIFMSLDDRTVQRYLEAMQPRNAARIIKEFKSPEEVERIQRVLEKMRQAQQQQQEQQQPSQQPSQMSPPSPQPSLAPPGQPQQASNKEP